MTCGIVIIGRNEGDRLRACFESLAGRADGEERISKTLPIVYVDSGSTDGSVELARSAGAEVVELHLGRQFSAARARNEGFARLMQIAPHVSYVQFIDGDCAVAKGWLKAAEQCLDQHPSYAVACGRRRERYPERSLYNRLCDIEWDTPLGDVPTCGGDALVRTAAFRQVGGYDPDVIAGEEPELCVRLRRAGWRIRRLDHEMTVHDAAMTRFGQWWKRAVRAGYAFALGAHLHGASPERHWVRETRSIWFWGLILPVVTLGLAWPTRGWSLFLVLGYAVLAVKVYRYLRIRAFSSGDAGLYAVSCVLAKFPQFQGQVRFYWSKMVSRPTRIMEYKDAPSASPTSV